MPPAIGVFTGRLDRVEWQTLRELFALNRRLAKASLLQAQLTQLWTSTYDRLGRRFLTTWLRALRWQRLPALQKLRRLAAKGRRLGRRILRQVATIVTPDTIRRWHRQLIVRKWTFTPKRPGRPRIMKEISSLILRMATENPGWGYTPIRLPACRSRRRISVFSSARAVDTATPEKLHA
jgi:hypothetical protein